MFRSLSLSLSLARSFTYITICSESKAIFCCSPCLCFDDIAPHGKQRQFLLPSTLFFLSLAHFDSLYQSFFFFSFARSFLSYICEWTHLQFEQQKKNFFFERKTKRTKKMRKWKLHAILQLPSAYLPKPVDRPYHICIESRRAAQSVSLAVSIVAKVATYFLHPPGFK